MSLSITQGINRLIIQSRLQNTTIWFLTGKFKYLNFIFLKLLKITFFMSLFFLFIIIYFVNNVKTLIIFDIFANTL